MVGTPADAFASAGFAHPTASIHLAVLAGPIRIAQMAAQDLARRVARQGFDEIHRFRRLEAGDALPREADYVRRRRLLAGLHHHDRFYRLAPLLIGHADHGDFGDVGMVADRAFDLGRIDILAAGDD